MHCYTTGYTIMNNEPVDSAKHFGEHVTIDGYGGEFSKLNDKDFVFSFVNNMVETLEMSRLSDTIIEWADPNDKKDCGGWSAFVMIKESHISIHTFPGKNFLSADVYTCRNGLDAQEISKIFKDSFELEEVEINFIHRGKKFLDIK